MYCQDQDNDWSPGISFYPTTQLLEKVPTLSRNFKNYFLGFPWAGLLHGKKWPKWKFYHIWSLKFISQILNAESRITWFFVPTTLALRPSPHRLWHMLTGCTIFDHEGLSDPVFQQLHFHSCLYKHIFLSKTSTKTRRKKNAPPKPAYQKRSFTTYAPHYWNELPPAIRSTSSRQDFKKLLKTHFFTLSYPFLTARH